MSSPLPPIVQEFRAKATDLYDEHKKIKSSTRDMVDDTDRETKRMGGLFGGVAKAAAGVAIGVAAAATATVAAIVRTGIQEAKDASAVNAQLEAGIKSTGNAAGVTLAGMNALASSIQAFSGQTDDSIAGAQSLLLTFTNIRNVGADKIFDQTTLAAANMAAKLGGDAATQAMMLGKALNDPIDGVTKLTRAGVQFTDAQKDQIKALQESGDMIGAQKIILAELETQFGGAAEAAGQSLPGSLARARRAFEDLSQGVVEKFLPIVTPAIAGVVDMLQRAAPYAEAFAGKVATGMQTAGEAIGRVFEAVRSSGAGEVLGSIADSIRGAFETLGPVLMPLVGQFLELWAALSPVQLIFKAIAPLIPTIVDTIVQLATTVGGALGTALGTILPIIAEVANLLASELGAILVELLPVVVELAGVLADVLGEAITQLTPVIVMVVQFVGQLLKAVLPLIEPILSLAMAFLPLLEPLLQLVGPILKPLIALFMALVEPLMQVVNAIIAFLVPAIETIVAGITDSLIPIIDAITQVLGGLIDFITGVFTGNWEKAWGGIVSIFSGIWNGIKGIVLGVMNTTIDIINGVIAGLNGLSSGIKDLTGGAIDLRIPSLPRLSFDIGTARVPGAYGAPLAAIVHGGEAILSNAMLEGRDPVPSRVVEAVQRQTGGGAPATAAPRGDTKVDVHVTTNASARRIAAEIGWELRRRG